MQLNNPDTVFTPETTRTMAAELATWADHNLAFMATEPLTEGESALATELNMIAENVAIARANRAQMLADIAGKT